MKIGKLQGKITRNGKKEAQLWAVRAETASQYQGTGARRVLMRVTRRPRLEICLQVRVKCPDLKWYHFDLGHAQETLSNAK